jgi:hypothetical protein
MEEKTAKRAWRPKEWGDEANVGKTTVFKLIKSEAIDARKRGTATLILTPPAEYLASLPPAGAKSSAT